MSRRIDVDAQDREILQEAVSYMSRRFFDPRDTQLILEIEERLDLARQQGGGSGRPAPLALDGPHVPLLRRVLDSYAEELNRPSSAASNRVRIARMHRLARRLKGSQGLLVGLRRWLFRS